MATTTLRNPPVDWYHSDSEHQYQPLPVSEPHADLKRNAGGHPLQSVARRRNLYPHDSPGPSTSTTVHEPMTWSINSILRKHQRTRLYVRPLHWTSEQLRLLELTFEWTAKQKMLGHLWSSNLNDEQARSAAEGAERAARFLRRSWYRDCKTAAVQMLLSAYGLVNCRFNLLYFFFNGRAVANIDTHGIFSCSTSADSVAVAPTVAYLDLGLIATNREESVKMARRNQLNLPVGRLRQKRQRLIRPPNDLEDPYITAVLIALAQRQRLRTQDASLASSNSQTTKGISNVAPTPPQSQPLAEILQSSSETDIMSEDTATSFQVHVLALPAKKSQKLFFYTARIPLEFLDRLESPSQSFPTSPIRISYFEIPFMSENEMFDATKYAVDLMHSTGLAVHPQPDCGLVSQDDIHGEVDAGSQVQK
ncbi:hypothetical protein QQX98_012069 [Neonectria punicea]|uniref:Uncharacterized protein n=1 Tax=Neonectria punicea TaxID=979145 RepID=A0ABR1GJT7_9HYPO